MDLKRKLSRLRPSAVPDLPLAVAPTTPAWPFAVRATPSGDVHVTEVTYEPGVRHGTVRIDHALAVTPEIVTTLALDSGLRAFDPATAVFLDTETTGLAGGTGTLAFLVGVASFVNRSLRLEQLFLADPGAERALLCSLAAKLSHAGAYVTFNGRSFDLPLLRSRFVLARLPPPPDLPHLDLLHVARRIYGSRVTRCTLTTLERDVLGFYRTEDIPGADVPERYLRFLHEDDRGGILPVVTHNTWDILALAALVGELGARAARADADGRWEPRDLLGLARTHLRAGNPSRAAHLAHEAAQDMDPTVARDAHALSAEGHHRAGQPSAAVERLLDALTHAPDDAVLHLRLAQCLERDLGAPDRALPHALRAAGAETPTANARRVGRLRRAVSRGAHRQLKLPGF